MAEEENGDVILIHELEVDARVGVPEEERSQAQRLLLSIKLWPQTPFDEMRDEIDRTVNYATVSREVQEFASQRIYKLIETLADEIAAHLLRLFPLQRVEIELRKFVLPDAKYVAVFLARENRLNP